MSHDLGNNNPTVPRHLGLILDGNRRWAKAQGIPSLEGHRMGYENLKTITRAAIERGVEFVSAYVFSTENWNRSAEEVAYLMKLLLWVTKHEVKDLDKENIRIVVLGSRERLSKPILKAIDSAEERTQNNTRGTLCLCLNYGGQQELVEATKRIVESGVPAKDITADTIASHLYHPEIPQVDFLIRTSGERRLSNFMLWRAAYSELYFVPINWPAFTVSDLDEALKEYAKRIRNFGR